VSQTVLRKVPRLPRCKVGFGQDEEADAVARCSDADEEGQVVFGSCIDSGDEILRLSRAKCSLLVDEDGARNGYRDRRECVSLFSRCGRMRVKLRRDAAWWFLIVASNPLMNVVVFPK
jgi:hypothetical protein